MFTGTLNEAGDTPLSLACANGHLEVIKYLIITLGCATNGELMPVTVFNMNASILILRNIERSLLYLV